MSAFDRLLEQIDAFIRKYYKNEIWKGVIIFFGFLLSSWLLVSTLEFFGRFSSNVRLFLLIVFIIGNLFIFGKYFIRPLMKLFAFGKRISREQASKIIGSFFPSISDRLLNTLQLNQVNNPNDRSFELIRASVAQRSNELVVVPFVDAVRFQELKKYLKYAIPVLLVFLGVLIFAPYLIVDGSKNVINYSEAQKAPFDFHLTAGNTTLKEGETCETKVRITGAYVPEYVFVVSDRGKYLMEKTGKNEFSYSFENMKQDMNFHFESEGFSSKGFTVDVIGKSSLGLLKAELLYPKYLNKKNESLTNIAELNVPEGTIVSWTVNAKNVKSLGIRNGASIKWYEGNFANFKQQYRNNGDLGIFLKNLVTQQTDSNSVQINVVKDAFPLISVVESIDSLKRAVRAFSGQVSDDIGLGNIVFFYHINKKSGKDVSRSIVVKRGLGNSDKFNFAVDFSREDLSIDDKISYHFKVYDNDGVNGAKSTSSQNFEYKLPSLEELHEERDNAQNDLQNSVADMLKKAQDFQKNMDNLQKEMLSKQKADFKMLERVQELQRQQEQLQQELKQTKEQLQNSNEQQEKLTEQDEELRKQQELIEQLLNELMDDELKKMLEEMEKLMQQNNKVEMQQKSEQIEENAEDKKNQLDRTLEMLKRLQVNEKIDALEKELEALSEEQKALEEQLAKDKLSAQEAEKKQEELNKKFDEIRKDIEEMLKMNKELNRPMNLSEFKELQEQIDQEMQNASDELNKGNDKKAQKKQKSAAENMKKLAEQMNQEQEANRSKEQAEDMALIRLLLENLMSLSFDQEMNLQSFIKVKDNDPYYRKLGRRQRRIIDDTKIVEDSLMALAKRQTKIALYVDQELKTIRDNFGLIVDNIDEHERRDLTSHQRLVMSAYNNLALILNESLQSMQEQQQKDQKEGSGSCSKPGGGGKPKPGKSGEMSPQDMKEMVKQQLEQMKKGMTPGGKQPGQKPGDKPGQGGPGSTGQPGENGMPGLSSKEFAKMVAQQTAMRQKLEQMRQELNKDGQGKGNQLNPLIKELEEQERELLKKNITPEMIRRQEDIMTRLLESDKALRERGEDEKRESKSGKNENYGNLIRFDEYKQLKFGQIEMLRAVDPMLSRYYRDKAGQYFNLSM